MTPAVLSEAWDNAGGGLTCNYSVHTKSSEQNKLHSKSKRPLLFINRPKGRQIRIKYEPSVPKRAD